MFLTWLIGGNTGLLVSFLESGRSFGMNLLSEHLWVDVIARGIAVLVVAESGIAEPLILRNLAPADLAVQMVANRTGG